MALIGIEREGGEEGEEVWIELEMLPKQFRLIARGMRTAMREGEKKRVRRRGEEPTDVVTRQQG